MATPRVREDLASGSTAASGTAALSDLKDYRNYKVICRCANAITFQFNAGVTAAKAVEVGTGTATAVVFKGNDGPWPYAEIAWSGNAGGATVNIESVVDTDEDE